MLSFHSSSLSLQDKGFPWILPFSLGVIAGQQKKDEIKTFVSDPGSSITLFFLFQTYTCDVFFAQSWKDNRLRLPDNMTSEYRSVRPSRTITDSRAQSTGFDRRRKQEREKRAKDLKNVTPSFCNRKNMAVLEFESRPCLPIVPRSPIEQGI